MPNFGRKFRDTIKIFEHPNLLRWKFAAKIVTSRFRALYPRHLCQKQGIRNFT